MTGILIIAIWIPFSPFFAFFTPFSRSAPTPDLDTLFARIFFFLEHLVRPPMGVTRPPPPPDYAPTKRYDYVMLPRSYILNAKISVIPLVIRCTSLTSLPASTYSAHIPKPTVAPANWFTHFCIVTAIPVLWLWSMRVYIRTMCVNQHHSNTKEIRVCELV